MGIGYDRKAAGIDPSEGFALYDGKAIELEEALGTDHTATGIIIDGQTAGENLVFGDLAYFKSDGKFWKADADAAATTDGILTIVLETIAAEATGKMLLYGFARDDSWSWTVGQWLYVSTTAGAITATAPSGAGNQVRKVGIAYSADIILFQPDSTIIQI